MPAEERPMQRVPSAATESVCAELSFEDLSSACASAVAALDEVFYEETRIAKGELLAVWPGVLGGATILMERSDKPDSVCTLIHGSKRADLRLGDAMYIAQLLSHQEALRGPFVLALLHAHETTTASLHEESMEELNCAWAFIRDNKLWKFPSCPDGLTKFVDENVQLTAATWVRGAGIILACFRCS